MLDDIKDLLRREPFVSFRVILTSGNSYDVISPYQLTTHERHLVYLYARTDRRAYLSTFDVVAVETLEDDELR